MRDLADDWRFGGSLISDDIDGEGRREASNLMLSMPRGTDPLAVRRAVSEFAKAELAGHKFGMVLHDHQANPHVHISARAESRAGIRLNSRKADLRRWRETFAEKLRELGNDAEASRQATRERSWNPDVLWRLKACQHGRLRIAPKKAYASAHVERAGEAWDAIAKALKSSPNPADVCLGEEVVRLQHGIAARVRSLEVKPDRSFQPNVAGGAPTR